MNLLSLKTQKYASYSFILKYKRKQSNEYEKLIQRNQFKELKFFLKKKEKNFMKNFNLPKFFLSNSFLDFFFYKFCFNPVIKIFQVYVGLKIVRKNQSNSFQFKKEFVLLKLNQFKV